MSRAPDAIPRVTVVWGDAHSLPPNEGLELRDVAKHHKPMQSVTTGWLLRRDLHGVSLANERQEDPATRAVTYRGHTFIPAGMILRITHAKKDRRKP